MAKQGGKISLAILILVYLLSSFRYFPGRLSLSLVETLIHILKIAPILMGAVLIFYSFYLRQSGEKPPVATLLKIALTLGIIIEFLIGLDHYINPPG